VGDNRAGPGGGVEAGDGADDDGRRHRAGQRPRRDHDFPAAEQPGAQRAEEVDGLGPVRGGVDVVALEPQRLAPPPQCLACAFIWLSINGQRLRTA